MQLLLFQVLIDSYYPDGFFERRGSFPVRAGKVRTQANFKGTAFVSPAGASINSYREGLGGGEFGCRKSLS